MKRKTLYINRTILLLFSFVVLFGGGITLAGNQRGYVGQSRMISSRGSSTTTSATVDAVQRTVDNVFIVSPAINGTLLWHSRPLKVGLIQKPWPMFELGNNNFLSGLNPDVMSLVLNQLHFNYQIYIGSHHEIQRLLDDGDIDVVVGYLKTQEDDKNYSFSVPYFYSEYRVAVLKTNKKIKEPLDLNNYGATIAMGVEDQVVYQKLLQFAPNVTIKVYENFKEASLSVYRGECDALLRDECVPFIKDTISFQQMRLLPNVYHDFLPITMVTRKRNEKLVFMMNDMLFKLMEKGKIKSIRDKYIVSDKKFFMVNEVLGKMNVMVALAMTFFALFVFFVIKLISKRRVNKYNAKLFRKILNHMPIAIFLSEVDDPFHMEYFNEISHWLRVERKKLIISPEYKDTDAKQRLEQMVTDIWESGKAKMGVFQLVTKETNDKHYFIVRIMKITDGDKHRLVMTSIDSTDLIGTKKLAELNDTRITNYLVDVSFEIRTLLNPIVGFSLLIPDVKDASTKDEYLNIVESNGQSLTELVNDVLILSKLESGQYKLFFQHVSIIDYLEMSQVNLAQDCKKLGFELVFDSYYQSFMQEVDVDLYQVFLEQVLKSSVLFMTPGELHLGLVECHGDLVIYASGNDNDYCKEQLREFAHRILEADYFVHKNGLSFAICFAVAKLLKAQIGFYHSPDEQVTLWLSLPIRNNSNVSNIDSDEFKKRKLEIENRWNCTWFELDKSGEFIERRKNEE